MGWLKNSVTKEKESDLLSYALAALKRSGLLYWRVANGAVLHNIGGKMIMKKSPIKGFPDLAGVFGDGRLWAIELKTSTGKLSPEQVEWITKLNHSGAMAVVLRSREEINTFIEAAKKHPAINCREFPNQFGETISVVNLP